MAEYHPMLVHFPIAFLTLYVIIEAASFITRNDKLKFTAQILLFAGVLTGVGAVLTGNQAAYSYINEIAERNSVVIETIEQHETYATILLWYFFFLLVARTTFILKKNLAKMRYILIVVFAIIGLYFIWISGYYGGKLVFEYGVGTNVLNQNIVE